ncbi:MAG: hypothetical protein QOJ65_975 [Fimbriimonadaceae bacterium]|jgi:hypothetical protein|nr:hypothetical protein [Fimbriimonadaceae bacterium]
MSACSALAQKSFVDPHVATDRSGAVLGVLWNVQGGQPLAASTTQWAFIGMEAMVSMIGNDPINNWLVASVNGTAKPLSFDIVSLRKSSTKKWTADELQNLSITLPACDVDSKDPDGIRFTAGANFKPSDSAPAAPSQDVAKKQKMWLQSNFRLRLGDLPCSRVTKIRNIQLIEVDGLEGDEGYASSPLVFDIPAADAPAFQKAFEATRNGSPILYNVQLDYLDTDGNRLLSLVTQMVVTSVGPTDIWADPTDPDATYRVVAIPDKNKSFTSLIR